MDIRADVKLAPMKAVVSYSALTGSPVDATQSKEVYQRSFNPFYLLFLLNSD
jgi:hypothetical protein